MSAHDPSDSPGFTHLDEEGRARMVDVGAKEVTRRRAVATGRIRMEPATLEAIRSGTTKKGDVLPVARIAGIQAAKETSRWIPLCHPLALESIQIDFEFVEPDAIRVISTATISGKTGVEMEALTAASAALLTIYDMAKAIDRGMVIEAVQLDEKSGGRSGEWKR